MKNFDFLSFLEKVIYLGSQLMHCKAEGIMMTKMKKSQEG